MFDCRCVPNPGREEKYRQRTGLQDDVIEFLEAQDDAAKFFASVSALVSQAVAMYVSRGFSHLGVHFGCTGGQHRSVYFSEKLAAKIRADFGGAVAVQVTHRDMPSFA